MRPFLIFGPIALLLATAPASAMTDDDFLRFAIQGDVSEAMLGRLAGQMCDTAALRSAGKTIEGDHDKARMEAEKLADFRGIKSPTLPAPDAAALAAKLKVLSGAAFARAFAAHMVKDHEQAIAAYKAEAGSGKGPVARYAQMSLPMLEKHLRIAENMEKTGGTGSAK